MNDYAAMSERILKLLSDNQLIYRMREQCTSLASDTFSRPMVEKTLLQAFRDVYPEHF